MSAYLTLREDDSGSLLDLIFWQNFMAIRPNLLVSKKMHPKEKRRANHGPPLRVYEIEKSDSKRLAPIRSYRDALAGTFPQHYC